MPSRSKHLHLTPEQRDDRSLAYRVRVLPDQLDRARRRVVHLEREAARLGLHHLLKSPMKGKPMEPTKQTADGSGARCPSDGQPCTMNCYRGHPARPCDPPKAQRKAQQVAA